MEFNFDTGTITGLAEVVAPANAFTITTSGGNGDGAMVLPFGNTAQRPATPAVGSMRLNTDTNDTEFWGGASWIANGSNGGGSGGGSVVAFYHGATDGMSGTGTIPYDNTTPLSTEGTLIWDKTVTPVDAASEFVITQSFMLDVAVSAKTIIFAVFRDNTCIYATGTWVPTAGKVVNSAIHVVDTPNTVANVTYSLRVGMSTSGTWYLNYGKNGPVTFGGTANRSDWTIMEMN
jgi:hypothetical protein